ncbi:hypothetical protein [Pelomonas cellulosilytica]|uniref:Uncharacterized protein n=1 Tax=Pelomonas cellulosilytica TaxID=2906762 RepID=A0ABS8Y3D5_9BURK|nr:hypothetical protein [Pelomonas sp. P8]MCE4557541.1 hypothetical protein [Pelomonas sp. P8]
MPPSFYRPLRRWLLRYAKSMDTAAMLDRSAKSALRTAAAAAKHSRAYRKLLAEQGISPDQIGATVTLSDLPVLTKESTFGRFPLDDLARPIAVTEIADVLTSSGRGGNSFGYKLTTRKEHDGSWFDIDLGLQDMFDIDSMPTLVVNCLPMGVIFQSRATTIANLSVREDMACSILRDVGPRFKQTLLCTDPVFIRQLLAQGRRIGLDWRALNTSVILGEEVLVEAQRDFFAAEMGISLDSNPHRTIGSTYGMGEIGLNLLFETRETIRMRRHQWQRSNDRHHMSLHDSATPNLFCFNPLRCHPEIVNPRPDGFGELVFTLLKTDATIPLPRYSSGDLARLIPREEAQTWATAAGTTPPWLPMLALHGRIKDRPGTLPSVERIKEWLYASHDIAQQLTGAFRMQGIDNDRIRITVQASPESTSAATLASQLIELLDEPSRRMLDLTIVSADAFPWRPALDFERKFAYLS